MLHVKRGVQIPFAVLIGALWRVRVVCEIRGLAEVFRRVFDHVEDLLVPFVLCVSVLELEHERSLQIGDFNGVVGAKFYVFAAVESAIHQHDEAKRVVVMCVQVGDVCVFDAEPTLFFEFEKKIITLFITKIT